MNEIGITWAQRRAGQIQDADALLGKAPQAEDVVKTVAEWLRAVLISPPSRVDREILLYCPADYGSLSTRLDEAELSEWGQFFDALAQQQQPVEETPLLAAERLLGRAVGLVIGHDPTGPAFDMAFGLIQCFYGLSGAVERAAVVALEADASARQALHELLTANVDEFTASPRRAIAFGDGVNSCALVQNYFSHSRLRDVWCNGPFSAQMFMRRQMAYNLLLHIDPKAWLGIVERFPAPEPVAEIMRSGAVESDGLRLCSLITAAESPFCADGSWRRENKAVFHLLQAAERLLAKHAGFKDDVGDEAAFNATLNDVMAAFAKRPDASAVGFAWLEELAWKDYVTDYWRPRHTSSVVVPDALARLFLAVAGVVQPFDRPLDWIEGSDRVWLSDRMLAVLAVLAGRVPSLTLEDLLIEVATKNLGGGIDRFLQGRMTLAEWIVGGVVASFPDPATWLQNLWRRSFWQRDRARHLSLRVHQEFVDVNTLCAVWAVAGLKRMDPKSFGARRLWIEIEKVVREARLTIGSVDVQGAATHAQRRLARLWPSVFPDDPSPGEPGSLSDFVAAFSGPDLEFASLILTLDAAGVPIEKLASVAGGRDILSSLMTQALDELSGHRRLGPSNDHVLLMEQLIFRLTLPV